MTDFPDVPDLPELLSPRDMPAVRTQADVERHWRALMGPLGFGSAALWMQLFDGDGRSTPMLTKIEALPAEPDQLMLDNLLQMSADAIDEVLGAGRVAFLYTRPGRARTTAADRAWAGGLIAAARRNGVPMHPVHLANDEELRVFAPDDAISPTA